MYSLCIIVANMREPQSPKGEGLTRTIEERVAEGELRWLTNMPIKGVPVDLIPISDKQFIKSLYARVGCEGVVIDTAMSIKGGEPTGIPSGIADMQGVYVDAQKWAELRPDPAIQS